MQAEPNNPTPHTQNTIGKQPKLRKQSFPRPQVWCKIFRSHTHTKRKNKITAEINSMEAISAIHTIFFEAKK